MTYDLGMQAALRAAGGPSALARALGLVPSAVTQWRSVPPRRVPAVAAITGIPRHVLRPDLYEAPPRIFPVPPLRGQENCDNARDRARGGKA